MSNGFRILELYGPLALRKTSARVCSGLRHRVVAVNQALHHPLRQALKSVIGKDVKRIETVIVSHATPLVAANPKGAKCLWSSATMPQPTLGVEPPTTSSFASAPAYPRLAVGGLRPRFRPKRVSLAPHCGYTRDGLQSAQRSVLRPKAS